ncbi:molecular chaperone DnaJ [Brumimicrobium salinarum]|uniref:Molecular chaperone DnaJ n=1 Tax=Brumimicrobium salinarum TaxID=2058658 RepID=A0A2I0R526_9FLAO|nr:KTSC domain-containing protein [Brumimicrobium salinarum]PKR81694.1 molecular chaperone DnaJ [Brumimicrobium salinarum]
MKRINQYKKLFNIDADIELSHLKKTYRTLVKLWHPDKFIEENEKSKEAELMSREITQGYEFLVSIAPETAKKNLDQYNEMLNNCPIVDYQWSKQVLEVDFSNGATYEYFGVSRKLYLKFLNADNQHRFGKRNIFNKNLYRKSKSAALAV